MRKITNLLDECEHKMSVFYPKRINFATYILLHSIIN